MSENANERRNIDLGSITKITFWKFTLPILGFVFFSAIYGTIDMFWISKLDTNAFYAVSVSIPIFSLIGSIGDALGQGTNSLMSRSIGSNDYENAHNTILHGILICLIIWVVVILTIPVLDDILILFGLNKCLNLIILYLRPMLISSIIFILPNFFSETLQAEGDSKRPTSIMIGCSMLNLVTDPILIFYFNLGIEGAAYATILSSLLSTLIFLYLYLGKKTDVAIHYKHFKFKPLITFEIFKVAVPNFIEDSIFCITAIFINSILFKEIGEMGILLYSTSCKLETLLISPVRSYGRGLMSVTGHLFGSKKIEDIKAMYKYVLKVSLITTIIVSIAFILLRNIIFNSFSIYCMELSVEYIALFGAVILSTLTIIMIASKILDGFGKSYYSLLFSILNLGVKIGLISILDDFIPYGSCVLVGIALTQIIFAGVYYVFLEYLFKRFERQNTENTLKVI